MKQIANIEHYSLLKTLPGDLPDHIFTPSQVIAENFRQLWKPERRNAERNK